ncbi:helix-turn-helix domain-containing protein [Lactiplantibacillus plantarum]|uniref:helix-turn-helix domain-containing protein n=1 Tax=Lactiplantibacillus plantarum TaxID=1590 RepID=UPI001EE30CE0|nr:helix-turn-helix transcriptional regulator [Lactiplantibacillus plantarum]
MKQKLRVLVNKGALLTFLDKKNMSIHDLAQKMNVAPSTIYRAIDEESPKGVGGETIANMLKALGLKERDFQKLFIFSQVLHLDNEMIETQE